MATDTERPTFKHWHAVPWSYLNDSRRIGLSQSAFGTLIDLYLLAHRDMHLRDDSHEWQSRQHLATYRNVDDVDLDDLVRVGFLEEDDDGIRLPDGEFVEQSMRARSDPTNATRQQRYRDRRKAGVPATDDLASDEQHAELKSLALRRGMDVDDLAELRRENTDKNSSAEMTVRDYYAVKAAIAAGPVPA